eukprot:m.50807 g.50807  ORF g.50807 m.50807 type:complete len:66 (-) comp10911_c1_seq1:85-282(-)
MNCFPLVLSLFDEFGVFQVHGQFIFVRFNTCAKYGHTNMSTFIFLNTQTKDNGLYLSLAKITKRT